MVCRKRVRLGMDHVVEEGVGRVYVSVHNATFDPSTSIKHAANLLRVMRTSICTNESLCPFYLVVLETDGSGNNNHKHVINNLALFDLFILGNMDKINMTHRCPIIYFLDTTERAMDFLNIGISVIELNYNVRVGD